MEEPGSSHVTDQVLVALRRIIRATDLHSRQLLRQFGITGPQLLVLRAVHLAEELSSGALAQTLSVSIPTASDIVARLEKRGLVARRRNSADKRQVLVSLTDDGRRILDAAPPPLQEGFTRQFGTLHEWERTQVLSVLQRVVAMMEAETLDVSPVLTSEELAADVRATPDDQPGRAPTLENEVAEAPG